MSLQDLVVASDKKEEPPRPAEILGDWTLRTSYRELADMAQRIASGAFEEVPRFAAYISTGYSLGSWPGGTSAVLKIIFLAEEAGKGDKKAAAWVASQFEIFARELLEKDRARRQELLVSRLDGALDYLEETFGEDVAGILAEACRVSLATASSWLKGASPREGSRKTILIVAREVFRLRERGVSLERIRIFFTVPLPSGKTPAQLFFNTYRCGFPSGLVRSLNSL